MGKPADPPAYSFPNEQMSSALMKLEPARLNGFSSTGLHSVQNPENDRESKTW
jgi:hypothetical protein